MCMKRNHRLWIDSIKYRVALQDSESFAQTSMITLFKDWLSMKTIGIGKSINKIQHHALPYNNRIIFKACGVVKYDLGDAPI